MTLNVEQPGGGLLLDLEFNRDLFDPSTADLVLDGVMAAVGWLASPGTARLAEAGLTTLSLRPAQSGLVRGYRTSAREIRACLLRHPAVADCVVTASGGAFAAYVVASRTRPDTKSAGWPSPFFAQAPRLPGARGDHRGRPHPPHAGQRLFCRAARADDNPKASAHASRAEAERMTLRRRYSKCFRRVLPESVLEMADDFFAPSRRQLQYSRYAWSYQLERELAAELSMRQFFRARDAARRGRGAAGAGGRGHRDDAAPGRAAASRRRPGRSPPAGLAAAAPAAHRRDRVPRPGLARTPAR